MDYYPLFREAMVHLGVDSYALLTRLPVDSYENYGKLPILSEGYVPPRGRFLRVTHPSAGWSLRTPLDLHA